MTPRTAKQRAAARRYVEQQQPTYIPQDAGHPESSWWTQAPSREAFSAKAQAEARRMRESKFGRAVSPMLEG